MKKSADALLSRRQMLGIASAVAGALIIPRSAFADGSQNPTSNDTRTKENLPVDQIEQIVGVPGEIKNGVLDITVARSDIGEVSGPRNVVFTSAFEIAGDVFFQPVGQGRAFLNADMALLPDEVNPFLSALLKNGLVFQAFHQHFPLMTPQIWFVHFRGLGDPIKLAKAVRNVLSVTRAPLPQAQPQNSTSPLDANRLANILHGHASAGDQGVVTVWVYRPPVRIDGVLVNPQANISTNIDFKPLGDSKAAVVSDFSMTADEVDPVVNLMLNDLDWFQGCLYNQETDEHPQLYFDHMLKTGDAYDLAAEIRRALDLTAAK